MRLQRRGKNPELSAVEEIDGRLCAKARDSLPGFLGEGRIQLEQGGVGPLEITPTQFPVMRALASAPCAQPGDWLIVVKPRQAMTSTLCLGWLLRETMYSAGANGLLVCNKDETNAELWARLRMMHSYLPSSIRVPCTKSAAKELQFSHHGRLKCTTAFGQDPALGFSVDRLVGSEFGFWPNARLTWGKLAPTLIKRKHARVVLETTPGPQGCLAQEVFFTALEGRGLFKPIFLRWYDYAAYTSETGPDFRPDQAELAYMNQWPGMTTGHIAFRRRMLESVYSGDSRLFDHFYPPSPYDGWLTDTNPAMPETPLKTLLNDSLADPPLGSAWEAVEPGEDYLIVCDPNGYGSDGDPSALTIWHLRERREVAAWSARMDPVKLATILAKLGKAFNNALIVLESNSAACITALVATGYGRVWHDGNVKHPGYYRTAVNKERAIVQLVQALNAGQMQIRSRAGLHQLLAWDGESNHRISASGEQHHWDRAVTYQIAADMLQLLRVKPRPEPYQVEGGIRYEALQKFYAAQKSVGVSKL